MALQWLDCHPLTLLGDVLYRSKVFLNRLIRGDPTSHLLIPYLIALLNYGWHHGRSRGNDSDNDEFSVMFWPFLQGISTLLNGIFRITLVKDLFLSFCKKKSSRGCWESMWNWQTPNTVLPNVSRLGWSCRKVLSIRLKNTTDWVCQKKRCSWNRYLPFFDRLEWTERDKKKQQFDIG